MSSSNNNQNIIPKTCNYNCGTRIYWNTSENAYYEAFSKKKHVCPNRSNKTSTTNNNTSSSNSVNRSSFYNKKPWSIKPKMSNSLELLQGPIQEIQKKYEILSDIVINEYNGRVHGSQSHINNNIISLVVYYEVPEGKREEVKQKFQNLLIPIKNFRNAR